MRAVLIAVLACIAHADDKAADVQDASVDDLSEDDIHELMNTQEFQDKFAERFITKLYDRIGLSEGSNDTSMQDFTQMFAEKFITKLYDKVLNTPELASALRGDDDGNYPELVDADGHKMTQAEADQEAADAWAAAAEAWATVAALANEAAMQDEEYDPEAMKADDDDDYAENQGEYDDHDDQYDAPEEELAETSEESDMTLPAAALFGAFMGSGLTLAHHFYGLRRAKSAGDNTPLLTGYSVV